ncbi:unnamed protein product, partial [Sphacelaria rigidula]
MASFHHSTPKARWTKIDQQAWNIESAKAMSESQLNTKLTRDASSNGTSHAQCTQLLRKKFRSGLKNILGKLPRTLLNFETNPADQNEQRTTICFCHSDNTSHLKLARIENMLDHVLNVSRNIKLRVCIKTQTSCMGGPNDLKQCPESQTRAGGEHQPLSMDQSKSPSTWAQHPDDARVHTRYSRLPQYSAIPAPTMTPHIYAHVQRQH